MLINSSEYLETIEQVKSEIKAAQYKAAVSVNQELILLYHSIGEVINAHKVWGSKFIDSLAKDIKIAFPNVKGYSVRNLKYMAKFAATYPDRQFVQTVSAQIPWSHNVAILDKVKDIWVFHRLDGQFALWRRQTGLEVGYLLRNGLALVKPAFDLMNQDIV